MINQYLVEMNCFYSDNLRRNVPITTKEKIAKNTDAIRLLVLDEIIWLQTAIESGEAVRRMH